MVAPGIYTVEVSAPGLQTFEERGIVMNQGNTLALPKVVLQVETNKEQVEVISGADVIVPLDTGQSSQTLNREMVEQLSIVGRDAAELIKIMPGMAMTVVSAKACGTVTRRPATPAPSARFQPTVRNRTAP